MHLTTGESSCQRSQDNILSKNLILNNNPMNDSPSSSLYPVRFPSKEPKTLSPAVPHGMHGSGVLSYSSIPDPYPASLLIAPDTKTVFCMTRLSAGTRPVRAGESPADTSLAQRHHSSPMGRVLSSGLKTSIVSSS